MKAFILAIGACVISCHQPPAQVANEVGIGLEGAACALDVYAVNNAQGKGVAQAVADAVIQCAKYGVTEGQATGLFAAHRNAERKEGFVPRDRTGQ